MPIISRSDLTTIYLEDGKAILYPNGNVRIEPHEGVRAIHLGVHDLAELFTLTCGDTAVALEIFARNLRHGHRFRDEGIDRYITNTEEPF